MLVSTGTTTKGSWTASLAWANWLYQCTCTGIIFLWLFFCIKHFQIHEIITSVTPVNTTRFVNNCIYIYWVLQVFSSHFISFRLTTYWLIISLSCRTWLHYWEYRMQRLHGCTLHFQICSILSKYIYIGWLAGPFNLLVDIKKGGGGGGAAQNLSFIRTTKLACWVSFRL